MPAAGQTRKKSGASKLAGQHDEPLAEDRAAPGQGAETRPLHWFTDSDLVPFSVTVDQFDAKFETGNVQRGAARQFRAEVTVTDRPGATPHQEVLEVNKPLSIGSTSVHLIGHGYAAKVTVKDGDGNVAFSGPVIFLPQDGNFTSAGAIKAPDARPERLGFQGFFLPSAVLDDQGPRSIFPDALNPALFINAWSGPPKTETGRPENVYSLDTTGMNPLKDADGETFRRGLQVGTGGAAGRQGIHPAGRLGALGQAAGQRHPGGHHLALGDRVCGDRSVPVVVHPTPTHLGPTAGRR